MQNKKNIIFRISCLVIFAVLWSSVSSAITVKDKYFKAEACYKRLRHNPEKQKRRDCWLSCIEKFKGVYKYDTSGPWAAAGLYMAGHLYAELYKHSRNKSDKDESIDIFQRIIKRFPKSRYQKKAKTAISVISQKRFAKKRVPKKKIVSKKTISSSKTCAVKNIKPSANNYSLIKGLRSWSNPSYTRIVIDASKETSYKHKYLKKDPSINKPQRLYIDLSNSRLENGLPKIIPINDDLLINARAAQYASDSVRMVVDIKSFKTYKIFSLKNPFRIVLDVWGKDIGKAYAKRNTGSGGNKSAVLTTSALAKQLALGVKTILIDPGHGGRDFGAPGCIKGVHEKRVVLQIAKKLAKKINKELNCKVILTRNTDKYLTLEERTAIANTKNADLFISIHTNAVRDKRAYGFETYYLNLATDNDAIMVAARENATSAKNISDLQAILSDLMQNAKINESSRLAVHVQESIYKHMKKKYSKVKSKGVKQAPFYVLMGAQMPAILIETSFISNKRECRRLINSDYQNRLCDAIVMGIKKYIREINPTALRGKYPQKKSS